MKKKLQSMGISSSEILNATEKKAVLGGGSWYSNPCRNGGPVMCYKPQNPTGDRYWYCDMQSCLATCGLNTGSPSICV